MPNTRSAKKQNRQNVKRRLVNQARKTEIKTIIKKFESMVEAKDFKAAADLLKQAESRLARAKGKGVLHWRTAARKTSRLAHALKIAATATTAAA